MKTKLICIPSICLAVAFSLSTGRASDITAVISGNWSDTNTWNTQVVPGRTNTVDVPGGINVTVDTNAMVQDIYDTGTVTMGPGSSLNVFDDQSIAPSVTLDTSAPSNTVIYSCNPFFAKQCNYNNLVLANTNWATPFPQYFPWPWQNFNNFATYGPTPMTISGNWTLMGAVKVQQGSGGAPINIGGNLIIGPGCDWDCSGDNLTVGGDVYVSGMLEDLNGALGTNSFLGSVIVSGPRTHTPVFPGTFTNGWNLGDVVTWGIGGSLTNNGAIFGVGYGTIFLNGTGSIGGTNIITIPTIKLGGTYTIANTLILTTNNADFNGTLQFDLANTNQIVLRGSPAGPNNQTTYYSGNLVVTDSGAPPVSGKSYKLFSAANYAGTFGSQTLPGLAPGLSWVDNLGTSGSIAVTGGGGSPVITLTRNGSLLTLVWDSATYPGYSVQAQTNSAGIGTHWTPAGSGTTSPFLVTVNPSNSPVFFRLSNP